MRRIRCKSSITDNWPPLRCELEPGHEGWHRQTVVMTWERGKPERAVAKKKSAPLVGKKGTGRKG